MTSVAGRVSSPAPGTQLRNAGLTLAGLVAAVFGPAVVTSVRELLGRSPALQTGWGDRVAAVEGAAFGVAVVIVVLRWLPRHAPDVMMRMRAGRVGTIRTVAAAAGYVAVAVLSGRVADALGGATVVPSFGHGAGALLVGTAAALAAAITEELVLLALAAAVIGYALRRHRAWQLPATLAMLVALRIAIHLHYGVAALFVLVWVPATYALYRWVGSVRPLIVGHAVYDLLLVVQQPYPSSRAVTHGVLVAVAVPGAAIATFALWHASRSCIRARWGLRSAPRSSAPDTTSAGSRPVEARRHASVPTVPA